MLNFSQLRILFIAGLVVLASVSPAVAGAFECESGYSDDGLLEKIESSYKSVTSLASSFTQESYFLGLNSRVKSGGKVYFAKPGKMDWRYQSPEEQRFVSNGSSVWFYQPELNQVSVSELAGAFRSDLPVSFLFGLGSLRDAFSLTKTCRTELGVLAILEPKSSDDALEQFYLVVDSTSFLPVAVKTVDLAGNETSIFLANKKLNTELASNQFEFEIPDGVDVIDHRSATSESIDDPSF